MPEIEYFCVTDEAGFCALAADWNRLAAEADPCSVFLRHEWFDAAWQWLRETVELRIVCVRRDSRLIGIWPLVSRRFRRSGVAVTALEFLTVPDSQVCGPLMAPEDVDVVVAGMMACLSSGDICWDVLNLEKLHAESAACLATAEALRRADCRVRVRQAGDNPCISLRDDWSAYYGRRSRRLKKGNNLIVNRLKRDNRQIEIHCYTGGADDIDIESLLDTLIRLSANSWKASTGLTLDNSGPGAFIRRLSEHALRNSWLLAWVLTIDGEPAAMEYQLDFNNVVSGLRADYDPRFDEYSPGTLLNWRIIERLFDRETAYYSLGPGSNAYKMRWAEESQGLANLYGYSTTLHGRLLGLLEMRLRPFVRRLKDRWRSDDSTTKK